MSNIRGDSASSEKAAAALEKLMSPDDAEAMADMRNELRTRSPLAAAADSD